MRWDTESITDRVIIQWTMDALNEADRLDDFLEFLEAIPGVLNSKLVQISTNTFVN